MLRMSYSDQFLSVVCPSDCPSINDNSSKAIEVICL